MYKVTCRVKIQLLKHILFWHSWPSFLSLSFSDILNVCHYFIHNHCCMVYWIACTHAYLHTLQQIYVTEFAKTRHLPHFMKIEIASVSYTVPCDGVVFELIHIIQPDLPSENLIKETDGERAHSQIYEFSLQLYFLPFSSEEVFTSSIPLECLWMTFRSSFYPTPFDDWWWRVFRFKDLYGKGVDERDHPSSMLSLTAEVDKERKDLFATSKVKRVFTSTV